MLQESEHAYIMSCQHQGRTIYTVFIDLLYAWYEFSYLVIVLIYNIELVFLHVLFGFDDGAGI